MWQRWKIGDFVSNGHISSFKSKLHYTWTFLTLCYKSILNFQGASVSEWLGLKALNHLPPYCCGFESQEWLSNSFMWESYPARLWNVDCSTWLSSNTWNYARRGTRGLPPPGEGLKMSLDSASATLTWCKTKFHIIATSTLNLFWFNSC